MRRTVQTRSTQSDAAGYTRPAGTVAGTVMARVVGSRSDTGVHFKEALLCGVGVVHCPHCPRRQRRGCEWTQPVVTRHSLVAAAHHVVHFRSAGSARGALAAVASPIDRCVNSRGTGSRTARPKAAATGSISEQNRGRVRRTTQRKSVYVEVVGTTSATRECDGRPGRGILGDPGVFALSTAASALAAHRGHSGRVPEAVTRLR
ncbi:hypothetical protein B0H11DRAFT_20749 [Mycena galericulata]|nr:hypothetical protein B0H11DRAFT_20749 [Mycena galericulata]